MKICMIVPDPMVKGGIAAVVNGYRGSTLEKKNEVTYIESYRDGSKWQKLWKALCAYAAFRKAVKRERPDVVHIHSSFGPSFYRKLPFILWSAHRGIPVVNHIHGAEFDTFYENASAGKKKLVSKIYNRCTRLIVLSQEWKNRIGKIVPSEKIDVIENYCKIPEMPDTEYRAYHHILFLGELGKRKGCYDIPEILEQVAKQVPDVQLIMAGDGEMQQVKAAFADRQLTDKVVFPGWVRGEQKEKLLRECGIFLFPSYHEGMPMAVLEAMGYAMGVVTTNVGGIPRLIRDGGNGYLKEPGDVRALAQAVISLLQNKADCKEMGKRARELAEKEYGLERHLEKLQAVYESAAGQGKR